MLAGEVGEEGFAGREAEAEVVGDGLADVGERVARAEVDSGARRLSVNKQRRVFACVVRAVKRRIVAMIRSDDHQVVFTHGGLDLRKPRVKMLEGFGVALGVATMSVEHVKVNEV